MSEILVPKALDFEKVDDCIEAYVEVREAKRKFDKEAKAKSAEFEFFLDQCSMWLRDKAESIGVDSFVSKKYGTAYKAVKKSYRVENWDDFIEFVKDTENWQLLEKRVAKKAAAEIHEEERAVPPGLLYVEEITFNVLSPRKTGTTDEL